MIKLKLSFSLRFSRLTFYSSLRPSFLTMCTSSIALSTLTSNDNISLLIISISNRLIQQPPVTVTMADCGSLAISAIVCTPGASSYLLQGHVLNDRSSIMNYIQSKFF